MGRYKITRISAVDEQTKKVWYGLHIRGKGGREWRCEAVTTSLEEAEAFMHYLQDSDLEEYHLKAVLEDWVTEQYLLK